MSFVPAIPQKGLYKSRVTGLPDVTRSSMPTEGSWHKMQHTSTRPRAQQGPAPQVTTVYFDGSCITNQEEEACTGIWYGEGDERNTALRIKSENPTHQVGEPAGACWTIMSEPLYNALHLIEDSKYVIQGLTKNLPREVRFIGIAHNDIFRAAAAALGTSPISTTFKWVNGHNGNEEAGKLAREGAMKDEFDDLDLEIEQNTTQQEHGSPN